VKTGKKNKKPFDCVEFKRKAQARIYRKIKGMTAKQEAAYFDQAASNGPFGDIWRNLVAKNRKAAPLGRVSRRSA
jgi:hypothetical protein